MTNIVDENTVIEFDPNRFFYHDYSSQNKEDDVKELATFFQELPKEKLKSMVAPIGMYNDGVVTAKSRAVESVEVIKEHFTKLVQEGTVFLYQFMTVLHTDFNTSTCKRTYKVRYDFIKGE